MSGAACVKPWDNIGERLSAGISCKKLKLLETAKTILTERQVGAVSSTWLKPVVSTAQIG
jgi:hypothetical protein